MRALFIIGSGYAKQFDIFKKILERHSIYPYITKNVRSSNSFKDGVGYYLITPSPSANGLIAVDTPLPEEKEKYLHAFAALHSLEKITVFDYTTGVEEGELMESFDAYHIGSLQEVK